ncbi:hypothetical protein AB0I53_19970 [Saccharopolyspora sp. NPDC050389]|uniref:hypothetical protein n=1 Tax=Saccharopolyspora sp. NPDC050389 TaxID=3155516 RepID=UPI0033C25649
MLDPDEWRNRHVHWHAYAEIYCRTAVDHTTRAQRLAGKPALVLLAPEDAANWIASMTRRHAHPSAIRLIGTETGIGHVGDDRHIDHDFVTNLDALCQGNSVYQDFPRQTDRLHLWVEAFTPDECPDVRHNQEFL